MSHQHFFASCPKGLEALLKDEIISVGVTKVRETRGGIHFQCESAKALDVLLYSRIASRIYKQLFNLLIRNEKDIYPWASKQNWPQIFNLNQTFKIHTLLDKKASQYFRNSFVLSQILKDGIVDQFKQETGDRPSIDTKRPHIGFLLRIESARKNRHWDATVLMDLCGKSLSDRGYRKNSFSAPLRENLAAGIILHTGWNPEKEIFIDSMCGSATLLIEAILIKAKIPPTYLKIKEFIEKNRQPWSFLKQKWFLELPSLKTDFHYKLENIHNHVLHSLNDLEEKQFFGYDLDQPTLRLAKRNISNALLAENIVILEKSDACKLSPPSNQSGIIVCNPPYGERMGSNLDELYHNYGENLKKNFKGYRAYIFTGNNELRKKISLQTSKRIQLYNGNIECRLLEYKLY